MIRLSCRSVASSALALGVALSSSLPIAARSASIKEQKEAAYSRAKEVMPADLYLVYRIAERLSIANDIKRPIRVAVRRNVDCSGMLGIAQDSEKCQSLQMLPDIDKASNFDIWAAQVVGTMKGDANAFAMSNAGTLFLNIAMLKELTGKVNQASCVIAHEMAHITQNHSEEKVKKTKELDIKAGDRIGKAVKNAHNAQQSGQTMALLFGAMAAGISGDTSSLNQTQLNIAISNFSAQAIAPQIAEQALAYTPAVGDSFTRMQGLTPGYVKRTLRDVNNYLRDFTLEMAGFSRQLEHEADLLGAEYVAAAGMKPDACKKLWTETLPHTQDKLIERLLPEGVKDPGIKTIASDDPYAGLTADEIAKMAYEKSMKTSKDIKEKDKEKERSDGKLESDKVPDEVMEQLASSHPDGISRAAAIDKYLSKKSDISKAERMGAARLNTIYVRNWSYDEQSDSVLISSEMVRPEQAGLKANGTTGIDIDQELGF